MESPFNGTGQLTAIGIFVAVIAYLRNVPMKELRDHFRSHSSRNFEGCAKYSIEKEKAGKYWLYCVYCFCQIALACTIWALCLRVMHSTLDHYAESKHLPEWAWQLDWFLALLFLVIASFFAILHAVLDLSEILWSLKKLSQLPSLNRECDEEKSRKAEEAAKKKSESGAESANATSSVAERRAVEGSA